MRIVDKASPPERTSSQMGVLPPDSTAGCTRIGGAWTIGFHGSVCAHCLAGTEGGLPVSSLALSYRSTGTQRWSVLTRLPDAGGDRSTPSRRNGAHPVGRDEKPPGRSIRGVPRRPEESFDAYFERRLAHAELLLMPNRGRGYAVLKRVIDIIGATLLLLLSAPIILVLIVLVRLDSPGPAIFRQQRVTRGGRVFTFFKFRTMWVDARERFPDLYDYQFTGELADTFYKLEDDPRNTRVGRWLRRTTLDELPNLINVLRGDMSLVGPRPELPELVPFYRPEELACFFTKAGLTGLAQVAGRSLLTVRERLLLDLRYVAQQSTLLDLRILWRTVLVVLLRRGAF